MSAPRLCGQVETTLSSVGQALDIMAGRFSERDDQRLEPRPARRSSQLTHGEDATADAAPGVMQEKVLAEIAHELGNFFHKLYYWSDFLKERPGRQSADLTAAEMLENTIRNLEGFLKISLDYFHPAPLAFTRMAAADLLEGLLFLARSNLNGTPVVVADTRTEREAEMMVDPGQLSRAFEVTVRHLTKHVGNDSSVRIEVRHGTRGGRVGLEVAFHLQNANDASPLFRTPEAGVEWALAQKVVALHGGELDENIHGQSGKCIDVFLPLCPA
jgi:signal transduction histidine kinase